MVLIFRLGNLVSFGLNLEYEIMRFFYLGGCPVGVWRLWVAGGCEEVTYGMSKWFFKLGPDRSDLDCLKSKIGLLVAKLSSS